MHFVQWYQPKVIADSFTTWTTASIKQVRYPTHRTRPENFGARHPSSVSPLGCQLPPGGSQEGLYEFARDFIKPRVPTAPLSRCGGSSPFRGALDAPTRCPLWGKCREAAKGVSSVTLSGYYSTNHTPSVSPYGLPAPPLGSRVSLAAPAGGGAPRSESG